MEKSKRKVTKKKQDNKVINDISYINLLKSKLYDFNPIKIQLYDITYTNILQFINEINNFIFKTNKIHYSDVFYKNYINNINMLNKSNIKDNKLTDKTANIYLILNDDDINIQYKYLRIQSFIINDSKIIGMVCNNLNLYFTDHLDIKNGIKIIETKINKIMRDFSLENNNYKYYLPNILNISNFLSYTNYFRFYKYNPFIINSIINSNDIVQDTRQLNINKALYETNLYNLLTLHIVDIFKKIKNTKLRNKLKLIISNFSQNDINLRSILLCNRH